MKASDIRDLSYEEILQKKEELSKEKFNLSLRLATRQVENPVRVRILRKDIARINTILKEHELGVRKLAESSGVTSDKKEQVDDEK
jgi:large subunit ribosomal protein L29